MVATAIALSLVAATYALMPAVAAAADTTPPSIPANVTATPSAAAPVIATVDWDASTDDVAVTGYTVWRSMTATATPVRLGDTNALTFADETGVPGQTYFYFVSAFDGSRNQSDRSTPAAGPVVAGWTQVPHATYTSAGRYCRMCHAPHQAATQASLMRQTSRAAGEISVCYACHDGQGASSNVMSGPSNSFALASGHTIESASTGGDLTNLCSGCHNAHVDYASGGAKLPRAEINSTPVAGPDNTWCLACHNDSSDWYGAGYPSVAAPSRDASGYPVLGTFPGRSVYENPALNAHASIPASGTVRQSGDCLYCHASHRAPNEYDSLVATFTPSGRTSVADDQANGTYAASCFDCHGGVLRSEFTTMPVDIKQFVTAGAARSGHRIKTPGGNLPVGSPLPCYDCHNPHGSARGNSELLADTLGRNLNTDTAENVRRTCFSCHSSGDGMVWDSVASSYVPVGVQEVEGLRRDGSDGSVLSIPAGVTGHDSSHVHSCYTCHGQDYGPGGYNVHNPTGGVSPGGVDCYSCHATYESYMEAGGADSTTVYHHVMGTGTSDGDTAFAPGSYPTSTSNLYCMSCHADHDQFNDDQAANLRLDLTSAATTSTTDYVSTGTYGICISCHAVSLPKDANQASDGSSATPKIVGGTGAGGFGTPGGVVAHDYIATSTFGDLTTFGANCSKCHNDEQTKDFQTSEDRFGTHYSAARRLLSALGGTVSDPLAESHCYRCHSEAGDLAGGKTGAEAGRDWYDAADMSAAAEDVYDQFQLAGSRHPVAATASGSVECESCHNVHVVRNTAGSFVSDPYNAYNLAAYSTTAQQAAYCLNCHDANGGPTRQVDNSIYIPYSVSLTATGMNKATYNGTGRTHWELTGSTRVAGSIPAVTGPVSCAVCHDNHGSDYAKLLGVRTATGNTINGQAITGNDTSVCRACHTSESTNYPIYVKSANYPISGTWPGWATYSNGTYGIHRAVDAGSNASTLPDYAAGDCKTCHNVHGTANTYDALNLPFTVTTFTVCFDCHDADAGAPADNIAQYYPATNGGTASNTDRRYGHKTVEAGSLPAGSSLPCWDCHNPHGSSNTYGLQIITQTSAANTISVTNFSTTAGTPYSNADGPQVRALCFTCHVPSSTSNGWNGSAYAAVSADARFEGLLRLTQLKLSNRMPHSQTDTRSCYQCHNNPHWPE